jgi:hypothetical protein
VYAFPVLRFPEHTRRVPCAGGAGVDSRYCGEAAGGRFAVYAFPVCRSSQNPYPIPAWESVVGSLDSCLIVRTGVAFERRKCH